MTWSHMTSDVENDLKLSELNVLSSFRLQQQNAVISEDLTVRGVGTTVQNPCLQLNPCFLKSIAYSYNIRSSVLVPPVLHIKVQKLFRYPLHSLEL